MPVINQVKNTDFFCPKNVDGMADKKESTLKDGTISQLRGIDSNGNSIIQDVSKVLKHELYLGEISSADDAIDGLYRYDGKINGYTAVYMILGFLIPIGPKGFQIATDGSSLFIRIHLKGAFTDWNKLI